MMDSMIALIEKVAGKQSTVILLLIYFVLIPPFVLLYQLFYKQKSLGKEKKRSNWKSAKYLEQHSPKDTARQY